MTLTKFKQSQTLHNLPGAAQLDNDYVCCHIEFGLDFPKRAMLRALS